MPLYLIGLIIVSIALGQQYDQSVGWLVLGTGLMLAGVFTGFLNYLDDRKKIG